MTNSLADEKARFEQALVNTIRKIMGEFDTVSKSEMGKIGSIEASTMGTFKDPETSKVYGFKFTIGRPGFHEDADDSDEEFNYLEDSDMEAR